MSDYLRHMQREAEHTLAQRAERARRSAERAQLVLAGRLLVRKSARALEPSPRGAFAELPAVSSQQWRRRCGPEAPGAQRRAAAARSACLAAGAQQQRGACTTVLAIWLLARLQYCHVPITRRYRFHF